MITLEALHTPLELPDIAARAQAELPRKRLLSKVGMAALILDQEGRALVNVHEASDGEFPQRSLGPLMETYRFVELANGRRLETPYEAFQRSLLEELAVGKEDFSAAGFYFDRAQPVSHGEWSFGPGEVYDEKFAIAASIIVRVTNPEILTSEFRLSEESLGTKFMPVEEVVSSPEPMRPGYLGWLREMIGKLGQPAEPGPFLEWLPPPITGDDVRYPYLAT
jgi:hypothetical protein